MFRHQEQAAQCDLSKAKVVGVTKWLRLETLTYTDEKGVERGWDRCVRTTKAKEGAVDAVLVITTLKGDNSSSSASDQIILVKQFRPALNSYTLEFPAGLMDAGETEEEAALRELKEECGYVGIVTGKSFPLPLTPGMSNEVCTSVAVEVDLALPENKNPVQKLDEGEFCQVLKFEKKTLLAALQQHASEGMQVSCDLYCFAHGLDMAQHS